MEGITMKNLLKTCILTVLCLAMLMSILPAHAANYGDFAIVTGSSTLNLRQGPGTEYDRLYTAKRNDWVMILGESNNWYQVMVMDNGKVGYMSKNFLTSANASTSTGITTGVVNNPVSTQFLNLRQYPSLSAPVLGIFYNGATFTVLSSVDNWYQVNINGQNGYFMKNFVRINAASGQKTAVISAPNAGKSNLRSAPSMTDSTILAQYPNGTRVQVLLEGNQFWRVSINGYVGYMDKNLLKYTASGIGTSTGSTPSGGSTASTAKPATKGYAYVSNPIATQVLNLREQASATSRVIAQYKNGVRFHVITPGEVWTKVYGSATGNVGYMMTKYLSLSNTDSTIKTIRNGNTYVNFRSAPSLTGSTVYDRLYTGTPVTVLTPGDQWTQVRYNGRTGYVMTQFLK